MVLTPVTTSTIYRVATRLGNSFLKVTVSLHLRHLRGNCMTACPPAHAASCPQLLHLIASLSHVCPHLVDLRFDPQLARTMVTLSPLSLTYVVSDCKYPHFPAQPLYPSFLFTCQQLTSASQFPHDACLGACTSSFSYAISPSRCRHLFLGQRLQPSLGSTL